jgi:hypothetical protein
LDTELHLFVFLFAHYQIIFYKSVLKMLFSLQVPHEIGATTGQALQCLLELFV